jgi:hypothetical protein
MLLLFLCLAGGTRAVAGEIVPWLTGTFSTRSVGGLVLYAPGSFYVWSGKYSIEAQWARTADSAWITGKPEVIYLNV